MAWVEERERERNRKRRKGRNNWRAFVYLHSVPRMVRMWKRRRLAPLCRSIVGRHVILNWLPSCSLPPSLNPSLPHSLALSSTSTARSGIFLSHARAHFCLAESYGISPPSAAAATGAAVAAFGKLGRGKVAKLATRRCARSLALRLSERMRRASECGKSS